MRFSLKKCCTTWRPRPRPPKMADPSTLTSVRDRKSTRLNSSHSQISYAVFCLKKKKPILLLLPGGCFPDSGSKLQLSVHITIVRVLPCLFERVIWHSQHVWSTCRRTRSLCHS